MKIRNLLLLTLTLSLCRVIILLQCPAIDLNPIEVTVHLERRARFKVVLRVWLGPRLVRGRRWKGIAGRWLLFFRP